MANKPPPPHLGGQAIFALRGSEWMRRIGSEGGHTTVSRYGTGYMALIGSAGAAERIARRLRPLGVDVTAPPLRCLTDDDIMEVNYESESLEGDY